MEISQTGGSGELIVGVTDIFNGTNGLFLYDNHGVLGEMAVTSGVTSVSNSDGTLTISPTTGAVVSSLNLAHANIWTGQQTFNASAPIFGTMTAGSVLFAGTSGLLSQDNSNLFWDATNHRLGIGTTSPATFLNVLGTTEQFRFGYDSTHYISNTVDSSGQFTMSPSLGSGAVPFFFGQGAVSQGWAFGGTDIRGVLTVQSNNSATYSPNTDMGDSGRALVMQNNNTSDAANLNAIITLQAHPTGSLSGGRILGDIRLVRETANSSNSFFMFSAFQQPSTYEDMARIGYDSSYFVSPLGIGTTSPTSLLSVGASSQFQVNTSGNTIANTLNFPAIIDNGYGNYLYWDNGEIQQMWPGWQAVYMYAPATGASAHRTLIVPNTGSSMYIYDANGGNITWVSGGGYNVAPNFQYSSGGPSIVSFLYIGSNNWIGTYVYG